MTSEEIIDTIKTIWSLIPKAQQDALIAFAAKEGKVLAKVVLAAAWHIVVEHVAAEIAKGNPDFMGLDLDKLYASPPFGMDGDGVPQPGPD